MVLAIWWGGSIVRLSSEIACRPQHMVNLQLNIVQ